VGEIERFNTNSERMLEKRCGEIESMMTRRINEILEKTEVEVKKTKKLSEEEYSQVKEEIKEALKIAKEIEVENETLKKENKDLLFRVNMLREEKNLLIGELNQKKLRLKALMVSIYEDSHGTISPKTSRVR
jgi:ribosomal protein S13